MNSTDHDDNIIPLIVCALKMDLINLAF